MGVPVGVGWQGVFVGLTTVKQQQVIEPCSAEFQFQIPIEQSKCNNDEEKKLCEEETVREEAIVLWLSILQSNFSLKCADVANNK